MSKLSNDSLLQVVPVVLMMTNNHSNHKNMTYCINILPKGVDRRLALVNNLSQLVKENWNQLFLGATRLCVAIESDYYATERVQIGNTRLHRAMGVKYASGWKYDGLVGPSEEQLIQTIADIQQLFDESSKEISCSFTLEVKTSK